MARKRYRKRSGLGGVVRDTAHVGSKISPIGALVLGALVFSLFYWVIPLWLETKLQGLEGNQFKPIVEIFYARRGNVLRWVGIASALVCIYFSIRNYFILSRASNTEISLSSFFAKILGRNID